jgi:hypothetical protein
MNSNLESARREIQKYTNRGGNNEGMTDQVAKKIKEKEEITATKLKSKSQNAPTELSAPSKYLPLVKSQLPDHDAELERDSSASPVVVRPPMNPRSPKPIKPAVGNITTAEVPYGSAMEDWEVIPGTVRTAMDNVNTGGHGKFIRGPRGLVSVNQVLVLTPHRSCLFSPPHPQQPHRHRICQYQLRHPYYP